VKRPRGGVSRGGIWRGGIVLLALVLAACGGPPLPFIGSPTPAQPRTLVVKAVEQGSGRALAGATVTGGQAPATTGANGSAKVTALPGTAVSVEATGYDKGTGTVPANGDLTVQLRNNTVTGTITDRTGAPVSGAKVFVDGQKQVVQSDAQGKYSLPGVPTHGTLIIKRAGYRLAELALDGSAKRDVAMQPFTVRALYAPASVFERTGGLAEMLANLDRTEANAMVIDVKEAGGYLYYATDLSTAKEAGAIKSAPLLDLDTLLPMLKKRGIYTIARMVVMKDDTLPDHRPQLAVHNVNTGRPWTDYRGNTWLDPYEPGVAEYIASIAGDLAAKGFDEVQLDYVRFFSDGDYNTADTSLPNTQSFRLPAIRRLFRLVSTTLAPTKAFLGADVFPISFIADDDQGIGQRPEVIMPYVDYFDPMVYPSHYAPYTWGYASPNDHPYEIINRSLKILNVEAKGLPLRIRPWIQDFGLPGMRTYTAADLRAEMKALNDNDAAGWMIWNAAAHFTLSALAGPRPNEASAPMTSAAPAPSTSASATASASP
jgi:hypothetical protein